MRTKLAGCSSRRDRSRWSESDVAQTLAREPARVQVRYPEISIVFLETRPLAEEWTFRYLGAALAEFESEQQAGPQLRAAELPLDYATVRPPPSKRRQKEGA